MSRASELSFSVTIDDAMNVVERYKFMDKTSRRVIHKSLAAGRWHELTLAQQMANIGSEVHRTRMAREQGNEAREAAAFERTLELFDLTISDKRWRTGRREIGRAREVFVDANDQEEYQTSLSWLDEYFLQFAVFARTSAAV